MKKTLTEPFLPTPMTHDESYLHISPDHATRMHKTANRMFLQIAYPKLIEKYVGGELVVLGTDGSGIRKTLHPGPETRMEMDEVGGGEPHMMPFFF